MRSDEFWGYFDGTFRPLLAAREESLSSIFSYLDAFDRPVGIIETGCCRSKEHWICDGGSTVLFDLYARTHPGSSVYSVDINPEATALCRGMVSDTVNLHTGDSIAYLRSFSDNPPPGFQLDLLYLDSYGPDFDNLTPSALHHMKEYAAIAPLVTEKTLVVIDDAFGEYFASVKNGQFFIIRSIPISGKAKFFAEFAREVGADLHFSGYQCGWTKLRSPKS